MRDVAIKVESLGKRYKIGRLQRRHDTLRDRIADARVLNLFKRRNGNSHVTADLRSPPSDSFIIWALKDVSFEVKRGEVVGIIGRNGAGKSTLLKILSRITEPTEGYADIQGRVGSLLEVGTGFHPELTGRENIYLNGSILGMKRAEIRRRFEEIVAFAEVEKFIDTPVKHYSSGMYLRLAFAVAAHLDPEILLVDEVLAVGDAEFQKKCLGKMRDVAGEGRTVLFVSHNMQAVSTLTKQCLLVSRGYCGQLGPTEAIISKYLNEGFLRQQIYTAQPSSLEPRVIRVEVRTSRSGNCQLIGEQFEVIFEISTPEPLRGTALSFQVVNSLSQPVLHILTLDSELPMCREVGTFELVCRIPKVRLYPGQYTLTFNFAERRSRSKFQSVENICPFEVINYQLRDYYWSPGSAMYVEDSYWEITRPSLVPANILTSNTAVSSSESDVLSNG